MQEEESMQEGNMKDENICDKAEIVPSEGSVAEEARVLGEEEAEAVFEAILFTMGDTVEISKLADVTDSI